MRCLTLICFYAHSYSLLGYVIIQTVQHNSGGNYSIYKCITNDTSINSRINGQSGPSRSNSSSVGIFTRSRDNLGNVHIAILISKKPLKVLLLLILFSINSEVPEVICFSNTERKSANNQSVIKSRSFTNDGVRLDHTISNSTVITSSNAMYNYHIFFCDVFGTTLSWFISGRRITEFQNIGENKSKVCDDVVYAATILIGKNTSQSCLASMMVIKSTSNINVTCRSDSTEVTINLSDTQGDEDNEVIKTTEEIKYDTSFTTFSEGPSSISIYASKTS